MSAEAAKDVWPAQDPAAGPHTRWQAAHRVSAATVSQGTWPALTYSVVNKDKQEIKVGLGNH